MKQTNIRASGKARTNRRNPQSPNGRLSSQEIAESTPAAPAPAAVKTSAPAAGDVSLILFHHGTDQTIAQVDLTSNEFAAMKQLVGSDVAAIGRFIEQAIREWIRHSQKYNAQQELTDAIDQAHALAELLTCRIQLDDGGGAYMNSIACGLVELNNQTHLRLKRAAPALKAGEQ